MMTPPHFIFEMFCLSGQIVCVAYVYKVQIQYETMLDPQKNVWNFKSLKLSKLALDIHFG